MGDYNIFNLSGNGINYQCYDNFKFQKDGFINLLPVSDSINSGIDLLKSSFEKNPNQKLTITGYYTKDDTSAFPDLGLARANDQKALPQTNLKPKAKCVILGLWLAILF
jgi:OOP family OmpA-OmpF porin